MAKQINLSEEEQRQADFNALPGVIEWLSLQEEISEMVRQWGWVKSREFRPQKGKDGKTTPAEHTMYTPPVKMGMRVQRRSGVGIEYGTVVDADALLIINHNGPIVHLDDGSILPYESYKAITTKGYFIPA